MKTTWAHYVVKWADILSDQYKKTSHNGMAQVSYVYPTSRLQ